MFGWFKKKLPLSNGTDFSEVDSREKAQELVQRGKLEKLHLMPLAFGGEDSPLNILYVPIGVVEIKSGIDTNVIDPLFEEGQVTKYTATPEYQGNSIVPIAIRIVASEPGDFTTTINIWGEALGRE
jgi:hypothetical protein